MLIPRKRYTVLFLMLSNCTLTNPAPVDKLRKVQDYYESTDGTTSFVLLQPSGKYFGIKTFKWSNRKIDFIYKRPFLKAVISHIVNVLLSRHLYQLNLWKMRSYLTPKYNRNRSASPKQQFVGFQRVPTSVRTLFLRLPEQTLLKKITLPTDTF